MTEPWRVRRSMRLDIDTCTGTHRITVVLAWTSATPVEVLMGIYGSREPTVWVTERDLLRDSLTGPVGEGQLRVVGHAHDPDLLQIILHSDALAVLTIKRLDLAKFLAATEQYVQIDAPLTVPDYVDQLWEVAP